MYDISSDKAWSAAQRDAFHTAIFNVGKNFAQISAETGKPYAECLRYYYDHFKAQLVAARKDCDTGITTSNIHLRIVSSYKLQFSVGHQDVSGCLVVWLQPRLKDVMDMFDFSNEVCFACGSPGELVCCDTCNLCEC